ncbi:hypothetical protein [Streptomyces sp. C10-9-1]|uniref:hypothetical protein n=1 Tax=Streptomyces sp. C10-9-1 TaxID=1859285 RepID=UPI003D72F689
MGSGTHRARLVELTREGNGIVGWDLADSEVVHGVNCAADASETVRAPWWRDA